MARRSGRGPDYDWGAVSGQINGMNLAVDTKEDGNNNVAFSTKVTIVRIRGSVNIQLDAGAADERALVACGIGIVSTDAAAVGGASTPGVGEDPGYPWIWHQFMWVSSLGEAAVQPQALFHRVEVDSKAMRRVGLNETLIFTCQIVKVVDGTGTLDVEYGLRILTAA